LDGVLSFKDLVATTTLAIRALFAGAIVALFAGSVRVFAAFEVLTASSSAVLP
jgi:hypothetical protein